MSSIMSEETYLKVCERSTCRGHLMKFELRLVEEMRLLWAEDDSRMTE